jgi:hypothetical protein
MHIKDLICQYEDAKEQNAYIYTCRRQGKRHMEGKHMYTATVPQ